MKFKRTSDLLKDAEILKGTAASDAHIVTGSEETATQSLCLTTVLQGTQELPECNL